jgi:hypothetical protein
VSDVNEDYGYLVDRNEIAHLLEVGPTAISNYVARTNDKHAPFPEPVISRSKGRFRLWDIREVEKWHTKTFPNRSHLWNEAEERISDFRRANTYS